MTTLIDLTNTVATLEQKIAQHLALDVQRIQQHAADLADRDARIAQLEAQLTNGGDAVLLDQLNTRIIEATARL